MPFQTLETAYTSKTTFITARSQMNKKLEMYNEILNEVKKAYEILKNYEGKKLGKKTREKIEFDFYNSGLGCLVSNIDDAFVWYVRNDNNIRKMGSRHQWELTIYKDMNEASPKVDSAKIYDDNKGYFVEFKNQIEKIEYNLSTDMPETMDRMHKDLELLKERCESFSKDLGCNIYY